MNFGQNGGQRPGFIFGGSTGVSYEDLKRKREQAQKISDGLSRTPNTFGGGLSALGQGLMLRNMNRKADAMEKEGRAKQDSAFQRLITERYGGGRAPASKQSPQLADPQMASSIRQGLIDRGLPEHVADGFVVNFQDESGLNPGINEVQPLVPGSRGGFGLAQWTGPRRQALEAFAAERGTQVADLDTQLDFLMTELQGSESGAARHILSTKDSAAAADAVLRQFLRPAPEHVERRSAQYTGGGFDPELIAAASSPWATPEQKSVLGMLLQQQIAGNTPMDPLKALQIQKGELELQQMRSRTPERRIVTGKDGYKYYEDSRERVLPDVVAEQEPADEYQRYAAEEKAAGREPLSRIDYAQAKRGKGTVVYDPTTGNRLVSIGGNDDPSDISDPSTPASMIASIDGILNDPALDKSTGLLAWTQNIPGTAARRFGARASQLEGQAFLQAFESLKGGGHITEIEGQKATQAIGRLDTAQSANDYRTALTELRDILQLGMSRQGQATNRPEGGDVGSQLPPIPEDFLRGVGDPNEAQRVWEALTPEERALFQ